MINNLKNMEENFKKAENVTLGESESMSDGHALIIESLASKKYPQDK